MRDGEVKRLPFLILLAGCLHAPPKGAGFLELKDNPRVSSIFVYRSGWIEPTLRDSVLSKWFPSVAGASEFGGCVRWSASVSTQIFIEKDDRLRVALDSAYTVWGIDRQDGYNATPMGVHFSCAPGQPSYHVHPFSTCDGDDCKAGGWDAGQCQPSIQDLVTLVETKAPFSVIQCAATAFRFYYPGELLNGRWVRKVTLGIP